MKPRWHLHHRHGATYHWVVEMPDGRVQRAVCGVRWFWSGGKS